MKANMDTAISITLEAEGGWADHPQDPGGKTMYGITEATYSRAVSAGVIKDVGGVANISVEQARTIYEQMYWSPVWGDDLPGGLDIVIFDLEVNSGRGTMRLQQALSSFGYACVVDNAMGPNTMAQLQAAIAAGLSVHKLIDEACSQNHMAWTADPNWGSFGLGWTRRGYRVSGEARAFVESA